MHVCIHNYIFFCFFWKCIFQHSFSFCTLMVVLHKNGKLRARDQSDDSATLYLELEVSWQNSGERHLTYLWDSLTVFVCRWICISVQFLYFCICDDAECSWRCVANPELNYGEIMQPPNQPASIILFLYQSSKSECSLCSVENDLDISLEKISATGWAPKVCCTEKVSLKVSQKKCKN